MARIADVMRLRVVSVRPDDTADVAIARMLEEDIGSVVVCDGDRLVGIFTERDVLRLAGEGSVSEALVRDVMTPSPVTIAPEDDILDAAALMSKRRIRHLPVVQDGNVWGVIGIREVMCTLVERLWQSHDAGARERARELLRRG